MNSQVKDHTDNNGHNIDEEDFSSNNSHSNSYRINKSDIEEDEKENRLKVEKRNLHKQGNYRILQFINYLK
jgi:hypothetical protein